MTNFTEFEGLSHAQQLRIRWRKVTSLRMAAAKQGQFERSPGQPDQYVFPDGSRLLIAPGRVEAH